MLSRAHLFGIAGGALLSTLAYAEAPRGPRNQMPQGGGVIYPAWRAEYFVNPDLRGTPSYTRSDIRISFDWQDWRPVLGVRAESARSFPTDNFSARWSGTLIARFDELYTFKLTSDERARLRIRPSGNPEWQTLIDAWEPHPRRSDQAQIALKPGQRYEIQIEYADLTGDAVCDLRWSSPSTPEEIVDYVSGNSIHFPMPEPLADLYSFSGTNENAAALGGIKVDDNGWPTEDFKVSLSQGFAHYAGRLRIDFKGQAEVRMGGVFVVGEKTFDGILPKGEGYDPATNTTRAYIDVAASDGPDMTKSVIQMVNTQRTPQSPVGSGMTELSVMLPKQVHGKETHEPGEVISQEARDAFLPVFSFRVQRTGLNEIAKWDERTLPSYSKIIGQKWRADMAYEKIILAANELGRDLHLNYSDSCDAEFMHKLALLMRYGSDGKEPYTQPTPNPIWPPLNPNLRLYLEHGNEMGWSGIQPREWTKRYDREIFRKDANPVWKVINFDGAVQDNSHFGVMRYHAYRTVMMSNAMRGVFGDQAMGDRIRVCLFGQYERWFQNGMLQFIDDYYNNPKYVKTPRAVSEILWGAGPAVYYGTTNNFMVGEAMYLNDGNFEAYNVPDGQAAIRPQGGAWAFEGNAGIVDNRAPRHLAITPTQSNATHKVDGQTAVGYRITVGNRDLYVYEVGRVVVDGDRARGFVNICTLDGQSVNNTKHAAAEFRETKTGDIVYSPLEYNGWATTDSSRVGVWKLDAGKSYLVLTNATPGTTIPGADTKLSAGPGLTIDGGVLLPGASVGQRGVDADSIQLVSSAGTGFPLATFRYSFATEASAGIKLAAADPLVDPTWPEGGKGKSFVPEYHRSGQQLAFIAGTGTIRQRFKVEKPSEYALVFTGHSSTNHGERDGDLPFRILINDEVIWNNARMGVSRKPAGGVFQWGTRYVHLDPGEHLLTIEADSPDTTRIAYFYAMHIGDIQDFAGGDTARNFLGAGAATGQTDGRFALVAQLTTAMAQNWGLVPYAYEGGTSAGGDWGGGNLFYADQFKWDHPLSKVADNQWAHFWHSYGGANAFYYYPGFIYKFIHRAEDFMPWAAAIERAHTWVLEPKGTVAAPVTFSPIKDKHYQSQPASTFDGWDHPFESGNAYQAGTESMKTPAMWKGFVFRAPSAGEYTITATTAGNGRIRLIVNDNQADVEAAAGGTASVKLFLTQSVHAIRVELVEGEIELKSVEVK
jgi:hypothetical protein